MYKTAILTYDGAALFELASAVELFALPRPEFEGWYDSEVVCFSSSPMRATGGLKIKARRVSSLAAYEMLVIPSWPTAGGVPGELSRELLAFRHAGKRILSFCSGAFLLAAMGFLDGRRTTTHWRYADRFKARFPRVHYVDDVLYLYEGELGISAGSAAGLDLGIEVIRRDFGYRVANQVARRLVMPPHRAGGQSQFTETPVLEKPGLFSQSLEWAMERLAEPISMNDFARRAGMSRRTFDRKFRGSFGLSPKAWLTARRLDLCRQVLETRPWDMETVAARGGFENAATMRHHFRARFGISPGQYRRQFAARGTVAKPEQSLART